MRGRGARLAVAVLFALACGAAAWQHFRLERRLAAQRVAAAAFDDEVRGLVPALIELRAAQQAYVAAGQGLEYWSARVTQEAGTIRSRIDGLRSRATTEEARSRIDAVRTALDDFARMDRRARDYAVADQRLLASDLVFGEVLDVMRAAALELDRARHSELAAHAGDTARLEKQRTLLAAGVAGLGLFFLLMQAMPAAPAPASSLAENPPARPSSPPAASFSIAPPPIREAQSPLPESTPSSARPAPARSAVDLPGTAELCLDLACVSDTEQVPALLERACGLLEASGIVLWIADPEGRELVAAVAHGYPESAVARLGAIPRDADNATAAAYRDQMVRTVSSEGGASGAIVAPLVAPGGCAGVMAAEVRHGREQREEVRAVATILAAQLATLIGVAPVAQPQARAN